MPNKHEFEGLAMRGAIILLADKVIPLPDNDVLEQVIDTSQTIERVGGKCKTDYCTAISKSCALWLRRRPRLMNGTEKFRLQGLYGFTPDHCIHLSDKTLAKASGNAFCQYTIIDVLLSFMSVVPNMKSRRGPLKLADDWSDSELPKTPDAGPLGVELLVQ